MNSRLHLAFDREISLGKELIASGNLEHAFKHLERAHVLGQLSVGPHARAHWLMLNLELRRWGIGAALGQTVRLLLGVLGSAVGVVPVGNTGGTDISMFRRLPIAPELQAIIDGSTSDPEGM